MTHNPKVAFTKKDKWQCLKPECVDTNTLYTLTINPTDEWQYFNSHNSELRYNNFYKHMSQFILTSLMPTSDVTVYVEVSTMGRLHVHGTIKIKDVFTFFVDTIPRLKAFGAFEIDTIKDQKWEDVYLHKQKSLIEPHLRRISTHIYKEKSITIFNTKTIIEDIKPKSKGRPKSLKLNLNN